MSAASEKLSVAIIVRNDATGLAATIGSIQAIADEVVVCDTGSTDDTPAVAESLGARVVTTTWNDDFSAARNFCRSHVRGDWLLWLDAGETVEDAAQLKEFVNGPQPPNTVFMMIVRVAPPPGQDRGEQVAQVRLVPASLPLTFSGRVRESMADSIMAAGCGVEGMPVRILRGSREHDRETKIRRGRRNIAIAQKALADQPDQLSVLLCLGEALHDLGDNERAIECFRGGMKLAAPESSSKRQAYYGLLGALDDLGDYARQLAVCSEAFQDFPLDVQILCVAGGCLQTQGNLNLAIRSYRTAYEFGQVDPTSWHMENVHEVALNCFVLASQLDGQVETALQLLDEIVAQRPHDVTAARARMQLLIKLGRADEAIAQLHSTPGYQEDELLVSAVRGACLANQSNWLAAKQELGQAYHAGCHDPICLRNLASCCLVTRDFELADLVMQTWRDIDPHRVEWTAFAEQLSAIRDEPRQLRVDPAQDIDAPSDATGSPAINVERAGQESP